MILPFRGFHHYSKLTFSSSRLASSKRVAEKSVYQSVANATASHSKRISVTIESLLKQIVAKELHEKLRESIDERINKKMKDSEYFKNKIAKTKTAIKDDLEAMMKDDLEAIIKEKVKVAVGRYVMAAITKDLQATINERATAAIEGDSIAAIMPQLKTEELTKLKTELMNLLGIESDKWSVKIKEQRKEFAELEKRYTELDDLLLKREQANSSQFKAMTDRLDLLESEVRRSRNIRPLA